MIKSIATHTSAPASTRTARPPVDGEGPPLDTLEKLQHAVESGELKLGAADRKKVMEAKLEPSKYPCSHYLFKPGSDVSQLPTTAQESRTPLEENRETIHKQVGMMHSQGTTGLIVILEGDNAAGKDGTVDHVFWINPADCAEHEFKQPLGEEKQWAGHPNQRFWMWTPGGPRVDAGKLAVFNRGPIGDRIFASKTDDEKALHSALANEWELGVTLGLPMNEHGRIDAAGTAAPPSRIVKIYLNVSYPVQIQRTIDRMRDKPCKTNLDDDVAEMTDDGKKHGETAKSYSEGMSANSSVTPWYVVGSDDKPLLRGAVADIIAANLGVIDPQIPTSNPDISAQQAADAIQAMEAQLERLGVKEHHHHHHKE